MARRRIKLFSKMAALRVGVLFAVLGAGALWMYWTQFRMAGESYRGPLPPLTQDEKELERRLDRHLVRLAEEIGARNCFEPEKLELAAAYVEEVLITAGLTAGREKGDHFLAPAGRGVDVPCRNICAELPGRDFTAACVVVGAHYDSGAGSPGANDNGTGVAALLELARGLGGRSLRRTIRIVAFTNEEPPFFQTEHMGSLVHARASKARGDRVFAMFSLETLGCYLDAPGTQRYPPPLGKLYPSTGNFVGFVGNQDSAWLVRDALASFRSSTSFPSEGAAPLELFPGVGWSDHWSFWQVGYPGIMVTDTAIYRYAQYHTADDRRAHISTDRLARVTAGLIRVVADLADRP